MAQQLKKRCGSCLPKAEVRSRASGSVLYSARLRAHCFRRNGIMVLNHTHQFMELKIEYAALWRLHLKNFQALIAPSFPF
jgi:hypothetical protein